MKKLLVAFLVLCMSISLFACAGKNSAKVDSGKPKLIMCCSAAFPPYEYRENNKIVGIDPECAELIAKKMGMELEIIDIAFNTLINTVTSGKADFAMSGMTVTEDRKKNVDFSNTYQQAVQSIIIKTGSTIKSKEDLVGKIIGVQTGTTGDQYCTNDYKDVSKIERYTKIVDAMQAFKAGKLDACVIDNEVAKNLVASVGEGFEILDTPYAIEEYAIAVKKGNEELLGKINSILEEIKSNGELDKIINKYIHD